MLVEVEKTNDYSGQRQYHLQDPTLLYSKYIIPWLGNPLFVSIT